MPRSPLLLLALLPCLAPGSARASDPVVPTTAGPLSLQHADVVVARLMSFDADGSGTIATHELPERMQPLVARGDADGNGVIDADEARALTGMPFRRATSRGALLSSGTYGFVDDITLSSRSHVESAIDDLRLPAGAREQALAIARRFMDTHEVTARAAFADALTDVLPAAHLALLEAAIDQALQPTVVTAPTPAVPVEVATVRAFRVASIDGARQVVMQVRTDLNRVVASHSLTPEQRAAAESAVKRLKEDLRLAGGARDALVEAMKGPLDAEMRDDLRAALGRRPVAPTGAHVFVSSAVQGSGRTGQVVLVPLVHRMER
jgi:hypothetical protein